MTGAVVAHAGVDVGGTTTRAVAFDAALRPLAIESVPTPRGAGAIVAAVGELVGAVAGAGAHDGPAVGVCVPGRVDGAAGTVDAAVNLGIDVPTPIADDLASALGRPVHLENDVNAAALGAFHRLDRPAGSSLAYVNVGTGIAAGFVLGGRLWRGASGGAGEIGHVPMRAGAPQCPCGQVGCAEAIGSGRAVGSDRSRRDDVLAAVAWSVQLCVLTLDPDVVVIGGGLTEEGEPFLGAVAERIAAMEATSPLLRSAGIGRRILLAPSGVPLGALGAVLAARSTPALPPLVGGAP